jgi:hypothetical protein
MKNLSEFKKLAIKGKILNCIYHLQFAGRNADMSPIYKDETRPSREISIVQTNAIALKTLKPDGSIQDQWLQWPKAKECEFVDNKCVIYENDNEGKRIKVLTYWF